MASIRVLLPPLRILAADTPLPLAVQEKAGWRRQAPLSLAELGRRWPGARVTVFLHPEDLTLTSVSLPPLTRARLRIAVEGAIEPLALGDPDTLRIGHGPRDADGWVAVAWVDAQAAADAQSLLAASGLSLAAFAPTPLWLPETASGWTLYCLDGYLVARQPDGRGALYALEMADGDTPSTLARTLGPDAAACAAGARQWIGAVPAQWRGDAADPVLPEAACGVMADIPWTIAAAADGHAAAGAWGWGRATTLAMAAAAVWMAGLALQATRLEHGAQALRQQQAQALRQVFPSITTVVDPLAQARRQLAARRAGTGDDWRELGFLLRAAREHMAFAAGDVLAWRYEAGGLELDMPPAARPGTQDAPADGKPAATPGWVQAARQAGLAVQATATGWRLRRAPADAEAGKAERS
ncbi:type II secretion system protein GspL [Achromobacter xylosoxidans]|uniref:type II secretion system protein GspL n=1 Tax=Alcaligenes xylosoxydans xylosoxydans TaxID=85698 RepID=UPI0006C1A93B|nr:type II secretion system protein GspL [Achromobacter xylosoxidans]MCH4592793.1 type II secretion system protein GspL [Achromobacter xylosoxidans]CUI65167.1 Type II secretory pathway%2C component PulL [Achromobacter xylosoxidans]